MNSLIISIMIVLLLIIKKFDSIVSNEKIINVTNKWHLDVKNNMNTICISSYKTIAKKILGKWFAILLITITITNYLSIAIFGNNSENNLLENKIILSMTFFIIIVLIGLLSSKKENYFIFFFMLIAIGITGYFFNQEISNSSQNISIFEKLTSWIAFILASILILGFTFLMLLIYKLIAYLFYLFLKYFFKFCMYLNPQKPLKPLIFITELLIILLIPVFHLIKNHPTIK